MSDIHGTREELVALIARLTAHHHSVVSSFDAISEKLNAEIERLTTLSDPKVRMLLVESDRAVCVGGRWDGWLFWLHPDGSWVSARRLPETEPEICAEEPTP